MWCWGCGIRNTLNIVGLEIYGIHKYDLDPCHIDETITHEIKIVFPILKQFTAKLEFLS